MHYLLKAYQMYQREKLADISLIYPKEQLFEIPQL